MNFYTYIHTRKDDLKVFYVGKGSSRRAHRVEQRSVFWKNVAAKHGYLVDICAYFKTEGEAHMHERFLIQCFRGMGAPLVNLTDGGEGTVGCIPSEETLRKRSVALTGKVRSAETKARMSAAATGRKMSPESIEKSRKANIGRVPTPEQRAARSALLKGRPQTPEVVAARTAKLVGKKRTPEFCAALSARQKGRKLSPEVIAKIAVANTGKKRTAEQKAKIWESRRRNAALRAVL